MHVPETGVVRKPGLTNKGIEVIAGAPLEAPEALVEKYLQKTLTTGAREHPVGCGCSTT